MTKEQITQFEGALLKFVLDVVEGRATSETALAIMPEVAAVLLEVEKLDRHY